MIINAVDKNNTMLIRWRDEKGKRLELEEKYSDFRPYFFIPLISREITNVSYTEFGQKYNIRLEYDNGDDEHPFMSLNNGRLKKVMWNTNKPAHARILRKEWPLTFEADVPFHYRYAVDKIHSIQEYDLRKLYWDLEWQQGGEHDGAITCISYYDSYVDNDNATIYYWLPKEESMSIKVSKNHVFFLSEKEMLEYFVFTINETDPDILISWFGSTFDLPKLLERLHANDIDPRRLSPVEVVKGVYFNEGIKLSKAAKGYSPIDQPIKGRICLNLDLAFERQWNDSQKGTLPSMALDFVAELVLGEKKLVSEKFPDKNDFFQRGWLEDTQRYLDYAQVDVDLLVKLDEKNLITESILSLQRLLVAPFDACFYASNMGGIYFMRNAWWKAPTGDREGERVEYEGAMIYNPETEGTNGLHLGVAAFDYAQLYPSMMIARNISWETKSIEPTEFAVNVLLPRDLSEESEFDYKYYKTDKLGLLPKAVLELKSLRDEYKKMRDDSTSKEDYDKYQTMQMAVKRLMASFYGITAYQGFGWADVELAASITASAREAIRIAAFKVMEV